MSKSKAMDGLGGVEAIYLCAQCSELAAEFKCKDCGIILCPDCALLPEKAILAHPCFDGHLMEAENATYDDIPLPVKLQHIKQKRIGA